MPRVHTVRSSGRSKTPLVCGNCRDPIEKGQQYKTWAFRYGGKRVRCMKPECAPKPSDLTQSKMGSVYDAQQAVPADTGDFDLSAVADALEDLVSVTQEVAGEYEEAASHFGQSGENQEKADLLNEWAESIEEKANAIREAADALDEVLSLAQECPV